MRTNLGFHNVIMALSLVLLTGCHTGTEPTKLPSESLEKSYFPLRIRNEWQYKVLESEPITVSVISKVQVKETEYFVLSSGQVLREREGVIYRRINDSEYLYLDFNRSLGDKWEQLPYERFAFVASSTDTISVEAGNFVNCIKVVSESPLDRTEDWYAPGIGLVKSYFQFKGGISIGGNLELYSATIGGKTIR